MKQTKITLLFSLFLFLFSFHASSKVIYVNHLSNGNNDGTSWQDAHVNFQSAINEAVYGDSIWVAEGTYKPTNGSIRQISFYLENGIKWFGGFEGNESAILERDIELYPTYLDGDIGIAGDSTDNSYHVVYTKGTDSTTVIDGFRIVNGYAVAVNNINNVNYGGGMIIEVEVANPVAKPKILNCVFQNNVAKINGGGLYLSTYASLQIHPTIEHCKFLDNNALLGYGGGIYWKGGTATGEEIVVSNCHFENNFAYNFGGAIMVENVPNPIIFDNCDFVANTSRIYGGAITIESLYFGQATLFSTLFSGCNFIQNHSESGGAIYSIVSNNLNLINPDFFKIKNCNFIENNASYQGGAIHIEKHIENSSNTLSIEGGEFIENQSSTGSAIFILNNDRCTSSGLECNSTILVKDCIYKNNKSIDIRTLSNVNVYVMNSIFENNTNLYQVIGGSFSRANSYFYNCTFLNNKEKVFSRKWGDNSVDSTFIQTYITNSILWQDQPLEEIFDNSDPDSILQGFNIHHSLFQSPDCLVNGINVCGDGMLYNIYPEFRDTMNGDLSLRSCSPALNQGDNATLDSLNLFLDIEGSPRILDDAVDLGAYETQAFRIYTPQIQDASCKGLVDGSIYWVQHGTAPYTYEWDNGATTGTDFTELGAGNYSITVVDADSCSQIFEATVNEPLELEIAETITDASAANQSDGNIEISPTGGTPEYQYFWSTGDTTTLIQNLSAGNYTVTVLDANNCFTTLEVEVEVGVMTGINNWTNDRGILISPNPTPGNVLLQLPDNRNSDWEITIYDSFGKVMLGRNLLMLEQEVRLDLQIFPAGIYFYEVKNRVGILGTGKVVKVGD